MLDSSIVSKIHAGKAVAIEASYSPSVNSHADEGASIFRAISTLRQSGTATSNIQVNLVTKNMKTGPREFLRISANNLREEVASQLTAILIISPLQFSEQIKATR